MMPDMLQLILFGSPEVRRHDLLVTGFRSSKAQALLYYLAVTGRSHMRPTLAGLFWGDQPETAARTSLSKCLSNLRELVGEAVLVDRQTVAFNHHQPYHLDTEHFLAGIGQPPTPETLHTWQAALALYRGDFLEGFYVREAPDFEQWVLVQRAHYREAVLQGLHTLANWHEQGGDLTAAIAHTRRLLMLEPWREEAHRQLMTRLARSGQRVAALAQFETCRRVLDEELAVEPDAETVALVEVIRAGEFDKVTRWQGDKVNAHQNHPVPLPLPIPPTPLIGRAGELTELGALLNDPSCRLITVTGVGGMGKTRLVLAAAAEQREKFQDGVVFVPLAAVANPAFLAHAILQSLAQPLQGAEMPQRQLLRYLQDKAMLLVLDNYEQLLPDVALLLELLAHTATIKLLVTSRERLALQAEQLFPLTGLAYPIPNLDSEITQFAAIQLFLQRARQIKPGYTLDRETGAAIARICQVSEGLPLAIELAAGALRTQSAAAIALVLNTNQALPTTRLRDLPARHTSMQAVFEHSWQLLTSQEQIALARLSVFRGGFGLGATEKVVEIDSETIFTLVDKSLVRIQGENRFDLHELLRQFAAAKLSECGGEETACQQHLHYFLALSEEAASHLRGADQAKWLDQLAVELGNLRTALTWVLSQESQASGARLGIALWRFWYVRGYYEEGWQWLEKLLNVTDQPALRATLLYAQGMIARRRGDSAAAVDRFTGSLNLHRQLGDQRGIASALRGLGFVYYYLGNYATARYHLEEALSLFRSLDDLEGIAVALDNLANMATSLEEAQRLYAESLTLRRRSGNLQGITMSLTGLAYCAINQTDYVAARGYMREHRQINETLGNQNGIAYGLLVLGQVAFAGDNLSEARQCYDESLQRCEQSNERSLLPFVTLLIGETLFKQGEDYQARCLFEKALVLYQETGAMPDVAKVLGYLARLELRAGEAERAFTLTVAATTLFATLPLYHLTHEQSEFEQVQVAAVQLLGAPAEARARRTGQQITANEAVAYALHRSNTGDGA